MIKVYLIRTELKSRAEVSKLAWTHVVQLASLDLCVSKESIFVKKEKHEKPYLYGHNEWQFNISHTKGMIAIAVSDKPIGIDVEIIRKNDLRIAQRFFASSEIDYINDAKSDGDQNKRFLEIWTKKEAYVKFTGEGMNRLLNTFSVFDIPVKNRTLFVDDYIISVCISNQDDSGITVENVDKKAK